MNLPLSAIENLVTDQIVKLRDLCHQKGATLRHVKPHGALYNQAAGDPELARTIANAILAIDPNLIIYGLAGSDSIAKAEEVGLRTASEVFADRTYRSDGSLTPRSQPNALIESDEDAIAQAIGFVRSNSVKATTGEIVPVKCETICIHGDGEHAVSFARKIRSSMLQNGIEIRSVT